jgi:hypothetical protein
MKQKVQRLRKYIHPSSVLLSICFIYIVLYILHAFMLEKTVYGDGRYYFSWLHTLFIDHDLLFTNEYSVFNIREPLLQSGLLRNIYSIGPALLWSPWYLLTHALVRSDGYNFIYQLTVGFVSVSFMLIGLLLLYHTLTKSFSRFISIAAVTTTALATHALYYGSLDPVNSHALSFGIVCILVSFLYTKPRPHPIIIGLFLGILTTIRIQNAIFLILFLPKNSVKHILLIIIGMILPVSLQMYLWAMLYGKVVIPYMTLGLTMNYLRPQILSVLFSSNNGLLFWTPSIALGLGGLLLEKKYRLYVVLFCIQLYIIASWHYWWQGASVSGRMFISLLPLITFGFATLYKNLQEQSWKPIHFTLLIGFFTLFNIASIGYYLYIH